MAYEGIYENGVEHQVLSYCSSPAGCENPCGSLISFDEPNAIVKVYCNNERCDAGQWMHKQCFLTWEKSVLAYLKSCGRSRNWTEKQRYQNVWTKKGYDLAYKVCDCKCGKGHLRKDPNYVSPRENQPAGPKKPRKGKKSEKLTTVNMNSSQNHARQQLRIRTCSFSSTGSSPPSSAETPPPFMMKRMENLWNDKNLTGNIFSKRTNLSAFAILPRQHQNPYHIKLDDEGPHGNDETRCFVLSSLSAQNAASVQCVVCLLTLEVYDRYPLVNGTFYLSPVSNPGCIPIETKACFLSAVCLSCLQMLKKRVTCKRCHKAWQGNNLVIGTMYSYDIFAAQVCCVARILCKSCSKPVQEDSQLEFYSYVGQKFKCPHCQCCDYHMIRPLSETYNLASL